MTVVASSSSGPNGSDRLSCWKDIASFLGKGVRTVQRWEKEFGLPVHRIGNDGGEIVLASKAEIERWLDEWQRARARGVQSPLSEAPRAGEAVVAADGVVSSAWRARAVGMAAIAVLLLVGAWVAVVQLRSAPTNLRPALDAAGQPARWVVEDDVLKVFNGEGRVLWRYAFDDPVDEAAYLTTNPPWSPQVSIADLDGDGSREVLVRAASTNRESRARFQCFNADGTRRWVRQLDDRIRVGDTTYGPPWAAHQYLITPNHDGSKTVWATFIHGMEFPTFLEQINADGTVVSRYWSNGYVLFIGEAVWQQRPVLLVGAVNNEHRGATFAVLDRGNPTGSAPAANPKYRCVDCPPGEPLAFVVFPPTAIGRVRGDGTAVHDAWVNDRDGFMVLMVDEPPHGMTGVGGSLFHTLDAAMRPVQLEVSLSFQQLWARVFKQGDLPRPYSPAEDREMSSILVWRNGAFVRQDPTRPTRLTQSLPQTR